ncbi:MAG: family 16 glycosylhydrolase [Ferruginibacter sp.]
MNKCSFYALFMLLLAAGCTDEKIIPVANPTQPVVDQNWQFESTPVWEDNFDQNGTPDPTKWTFEIGGSGWGNNEQQYYTPTNAAVQDGQLTITARKEFSNGRSYTSSRIITKGRGDFQYGRFEMRAKLPKGRGTWPAFWLLPTENYYGIWPSSGEMDVMEHVGYDVNNVHASVHCSAYNHSRGNQKTAARNVPGATDEFHTYRLDWTPYSIKGFVDGEQYFEFVNENKGFTAWPFNRPYYLILNLAVGGNWGGAQGIDDTVFPTSYVVDYVRVYKMIP